MRIHVMCAHKKLSSLPFSLYRTHKRTHTTTKTQHSTFSDCQIKKQIGAVYLDNNKFCICFVLSWYVSVFHSVPNAAGFIDYQRKKKNEKKTTKWFGSCDLMLVAATSPGSHAFKLTGPFFFGEKTSKNCKC